MDERHPLAGIPAARRERALFLRPHRARRERAGGGAALHALHAGRGRAAAIRGLGEDRAGARPHPGAVRPDLQLTMTGPMRADMARQPEVIAGLLDRAPDFLAAGAAMAPG